MRLALAHLADLAAQGLSRRCGQAVRVTLGEVGPMGLDQFRRGACEPTNLFQMGPGGGSSARPALVLDFSPSLAFGLIDLLLGGVGNETPTIGRGLTVVQRRLLEMFARGIAQSVGPLGPCRGQGIVAGCLEVEAEAVRGQLHLGVSEEAAVSLGERLAAEQAMVELRVQLPPVPADRADLAGLAAGDVLDTELPADAPAQVLIDGEIRFTGRLGLSGNQRAAWLDPPPRKPPGPARD